MSSLKKSRLSRSTSSSQGEVEALMMPIDSSLISCKGKEVDHVKSLIINDNSSQMKVVENDNNKKSIWIMDDVSLGVEECDQSRIDDQRFGCFWETCALCKKSINVDLNIYMYGFLQAFCSVECRNAKIAVDIRFGRPSPQQQQKESSSTPRRVGRRSEASRYRQ